MNSNSPDPGYNSSKEKEEETLKPQDKESQAVKLTLQPWPSKSQQWLVSNLVREI